MNPSFTEIKSFLKSFLQAEADASNARSFPDLKLMNETLEKMNHYCIEELHNTFGMIPETELKPLSFYEEEQRFPPPIPRHLFKISHYFNEKYGDTFLVYVSQSFPSQITITIFECFFITQVTNEWKIVKKYNFSEDDWSPTPYLPTWNESMGFKDLKFETAGKLIAIERYLEPNYGKEAIEEYWKEM